MNLLGGGHSQDKKIREQQCREERKRQKFLERGRDGHSARPAPGPGVMPYSCRGGVGYSWSRGAVVSGQDVERELGSPVTGSQLGPQREGIAAASESRAGAPRPKGRKGQALGTPPVSGTRASAIWTLGAEEEGTGLAGLRKEEEGGRREEGRRDEVWARNLSLSRLCN